ncbi:disintegrin and metalloproteinase domain-containing protein 21-like [Erythrolamprus reginae]|uniref:disintegrin and metalloproteinase domain-containing protein 21-like n=1 Tax=Erythrolamprus reginae TaxID=121349 RepID=UPI00396C5C58
MTRVSRGLGRWCLPPLATSIVLVVFTLPAIHGSSWFPPPYSSYEVVIPKRLGARGGDGISYSIKVAGRDYVLQLNPSKRLLAENFPVFTYDSEGKRVESHPYLPVECYHQGYVEGIVESLAVLRTCLGLTGLLKIGARVYGIEPLQNSSTFQHILYLSKEPQPVFSPYQTGVGGRTTHRAKDGRSRQTRALYDYILFEDVPKYIELYIVVDKAVFQKQGNNVSRVQTLVLDVVNIADTTFDSLKTNLVLVGLEIWTENTLIDLSGTFTDTLDNFNKWRMTNMTHRAVYDTAFFFFQSRGKYLFGRSYHSAICNPALSAGIQTVIEDDLTRFAKGFCHELGSHVGLDHDHSYCTCGTQISCTMYAYHAVANLFSNCSALNFVDLFEQGHLDCLKNTPNIPSKFHRCGNGVLDVGEECDCGKPSACADDPCCTPDCRLKKNAICGSGKCCQKCAFAPKGHLCRAKVNECDLPEYCNGSTAKCPRDFYLQDGTPCSKYSSYCYKKRCWNHDMLCRRIFKGHAVSAPDNCYKNLNILGTIYGNCGVDSVKRKLVECPLQDTMCGKLQCDKVTVPIDPTILKVNRVLNKDLMCHSVSHPSEIYHDDIGSVPDGIVCQPYKICLDHKCISKSELNFSCDSRKKCLGRGVCNNMNNCHCNNGWAPPDCKFWGAGGSIDGGIPRMSFGSTLLRNVLGTIIPFCMLTIAAVVVVFPKVWEILGPAVKCCKYTVNKMLIRRQKSDTQEAELEIS